MLEKFQQHLKKNFPHLKGKRLFLAVSGGVDSIVMLHLFQELEYEIAILHCNFQLRGMESDEDESFIINYAEKFQIQIFTQKFDTEKFANENKLSIQLAARKLRYDWFNQLLQSEKYDYLVTAHHLDDQVETFLINFTRGTGLEGLTGIPTQNEKVIRPLLLFSRDEILAYANENNIEWREDSSNASDKYFRNKIRHLIVPVLKELNPNFLSSFQDTLEHLKESNALVVDASKWVYEKVVEEIEDKIQINIAKLLEYSNYKNYLYQWINPYGFSAWQDIYELVEAQSGKQIFSNSHVLLKDRDVLILYKSDNKLDTISFLIEKPQETLKFPLNISLCKVDDIVESTNNTIFVDEEKLQFPLEIRKKREGDYFYPAGMDGKKKLSKYFKDEKYSLLDKDNQWILTSNDKIVWVIGKRVDKNFLAHANTKNILKIEFL